MSEEDSEGETIGEKSKRKNYSSSVEEMLKKAGQRWNSAELGKDRKPWMSPNDE